MFLTKVGLLQQRETKKRHCLTLLAWEKQEMGVYPPRAKRRQSLILQHPHSPVLPAEMLGEAEEARSMGI